MADDKKGSGLNPKQMANLPLKSEKSDEQQASGQQVPPGDVQQVRNGNRFAAMFAAPIFAAATNPQIYEQRGGKSKQIARVLLPQRHPVTGDLLGVSLTGTIYAKQTTGAAKARAVFSWTRNALVIDESDKSAVAEMADYEASIVAAYIERRKAKDVPVAQTGGVELDDVSL